MPNEIDFTGGVRGKYADRYREGVTIREIAPPDPIAFYETQSRLGYALWHAQILEAAFVAYLALVLDMAVQDAGVRAHQLLEHEVSDKQFTQWWSSFEDFKGFLDRFHRIRLERNWIVHRSSFDLAELVQSPSGKHELSTRLEGFADEAQYLTQYLFKAVEASLSDRGMTPAQIDERTRQVIDAWATP